MRNHPQGASAPRRPAAMLAMLLVVGSGLVASVSQAATYAVIISVSESGSGNPLPVARANREAIYEAFKSLLQIPESSIYVLADRDVTKNALRRFFTSQLPPSLSAGDLVLVYYSGHGALGLVAGVPVRRYFTYDTEQNYTATGVGDRWLEDTVFSDIELRRWLQPINGKNVETILLRECCFNGQGYSDVLQQASILRESQRIDVVACYELSACSENQAAYATVKDGRTLGVFTAALLEALKSADTAITLEELASHVERQVSAVQPLQSPQRGGKYQSDFRRLTLIDRSKMTVIVRARDSVTDAEVVGARVILPGCSDALTPATFQDVARSNRHLYPRLDKEGYPQQVFTLDLDAFAARQERWVTLDPLFAQVEGQVVESRGRILDSVRIGFEYVGPPPSVSRYFDQEVAPDVEGRFRLRLPPGYSWRVVVFSQGTVLARAIVNDGHPLEPMHLFDSTSDKLVHREPYRIGTLSVTLPLSGPTEEERQFDLYLSQGQEQLEKGELSSAQHSFELARQAVARAPASTRNELQQRAERAEERVKVVSRAKQLESLELRAQDARRAGSLALAESSARAALQIDHDVLWANLLLQDLARGKDRTLEDHSESERQSVEKHSTNPTDSSVLRVEGFTYRGKNVQGLGEYLQDKSGLEFVFIPGGTFEMGSPADEAEGDGDETPHTITLSPFLIGKYELTQDVWEKVMGSNPSASRKGMRYPVDSVTWGDASSLCRRLGLELPTEAQWEYACRADTMGVFAGSLETMGWYYRNSARGTQPVGQKSPNSWGLYDMHGNVQEWCRDWYGPYSEGSATDPTGPREGKSHVLRGGSWWSDTRYCRSANRSRHDPTVRMDTIGFRPCWSIAQKSKDG